MKTLRLLILPTFGSTRESMGIEDFEDIDSESILFQQGYDADVIEVEDNGIFRIEVGFIGSILEEELEVYLEENDDVEFKIDDAFEIDDDIDKIYYLINDLEDLEEKYKFILEEDLEAGSYKFLSEHHAILSLEEE